MTVKNDASKSQPGAGPTEGQEPKSESSENTDTTDSNQDDSWKDQALAEARSEAAKYRKQLREIEAAKEAAEQAKLEEQGEYKALAEKAEKKALALQEQLVSMQERVKQSAVQAKLDAALAKAGLEETAAKKVRKLALDDLEVEFDENLNLVKHNAHKAVEAQLKDLGLDKVKGQEPDTETKPKNGATTFQGYGRIGQTAVSDDLAGPLDPRSVFRQAGEKYLGG